MKPYRPSILRLQQEWSMRIARDVMKRRRKPVPPSKITDNSVPWMENPGTVADFLEISRQIGENKHQWLEMFQGSSKP